MGIPDDAKTTKHTTGMSVDPNDITISDAVSTMMSKFDQEKLANVQVMVEQAKDDPESFLAYILISIHDMRGMLDVVIETLVKHDMLTVTVSDDDQKEH